MAGQEGTLGNVAGAELHWILVEIDAVLYLPR